MAFSDNPRAFTKANIEALNAGQIGCYGLYRETTWVYIGPGDIRDRLLAHLNGDNPCITRETPTHWVDVVTSDDENEEKRLITQYTPVCNKRVG